MLEELLNGRQTGNTLLIGSEPHVLHPLINSCVVAHVQSSVPVHVVTPLLSPWLRRLHSPETEKWLTMYQLASDRPLLGDDSRVEDVWTSPFDMKKTLCRAVAAADKCQRGLLVIHNVSAVLTCCNVNWLCSLLGSYLKHADSAVSELHSSAGSAGHSLLLTADHDSSHDSDLAALCYYATNTVYVRREEQHSAAVTASTVLQCQITDRRRPQSGPTCLLVQVNEHDQLVRVSSQQTGGVTTDSRQQEASTRSALQRLCTFSVSLSETERVDRDQLVPPYYQQPQLPAKLPSCPAGSTAGGGEILYHPGVDDDWDDEDPDDDLDI